MPKSAKTRLRLKSEKFRKAEPAKHSLVCNSLDILAAIYKKQANG